MADPPVFELVDSDGNVVGEFKQVSGETVIENQENDTVRIPSLSTDEIAINPHDSIIGMESGEEAFSGPTASDNSDFSDNKNVVYSVTFDSEFDTRPDVVSSLSSGQAGLVTDVFNVSTTGFDILVYNYAAKDRSSDTLTVQWVAIAD